MGSRAGGRRDEEVGGDGPKRAVREHGRQARQRLYSSELSREEKDAERLDGLWRVEPDTSRPVSRRPAVLQWDSCPLVGLARNAARLKGAELPKGAMPLGSVVLQPL